jgi:hypothetical protein
MASLRGTKQSLLISFYFTVLFIFISGQAFIYVLLLEGDCFVSRNDVLINISNNFQIFKLAYLQIIYSL